MTPEDNPADDRIELDQCIEEIKRLQAAIRKHRDQRGDDRCWLDDEELYRALPEGFTPPARDSAVELVNCQRFIHCRQHPATLYVSPQRRIEELEAMLRELVEDASPGEFPDSPIVNIELIKKAAELLKK